MPINYDLVQDKPLQWLAGVYANGELTNVPEEIQDLFDNLNS